MQKVDGKDIVWLFRYKDCSKNLKIKDVQETITGDFKMCDKRLELFMPNFSNKNQNLQRNHIK